MNVEFSLNVALFQELQDYLEYFPTYKSLMSKNVGLRSKTPAMPPFRCDRARIRKCLVSPLTVF